MKLLSLVMLLGTFHCSLLLADEGDIKTTDLNHEEVSRAEASIPNEQVSAEQVDQLKKQYEEFKVNQQKMQDAMKEVEDDL